MTQTDAMPTVLVIDDDLGPRESLRFLLNTNHVVLCADNVDRGLEMLRTHAPEVVIMDIRMPGRDGIEGLKAVREFDPNVAVIMLTGYASLGSAQEAVRHAANDYLEKPFDATTMRYTVQHHALRTRLRRRHAHLTQETERINTRLSNEFAGKAHLAELGQASAEFVHDLRNALCVARCSADLLQQDATTGRPAGTPQQPIDVTDYLQTIERSMRQCSEMLDAWQRLINQDPAQQKVLPLNELLRDVVAACQPAALAAHVQLTCDGTAGGAEVLGDRVQLVRAFNNITTNAIQAVAAQTGQVAVHLACENGQAIITIRDNGCGITRDNLKRIFESNFTTRKSKGGMGLGLFISRKVIEMHGGLLEVASEVGKGSTFRINLPLFIGA